ncbi:MAG: hypothetical protein UH854_03870 [Clostridia bacterium]|nr:hypothetical protein [Clostridia bacterium]
MKIEELNSCFDAISPTAEQRNKMLANIMNAKQQPVKVVRFYRYATAVAAVFVIGIFGVVYSTMGLNNITDYGTKTMVATEFAEKEEVVSNTENYDYLLETVEEERKIADSMLEAYPIETDTTNDTKVAVAEDVIQDTVVPEVALEDALNEPMATSENEPSVFSAASGGGGSAYSKMVEAETLSLEQIMNHEVYSKLFPTKFAGEFVFVSANVNGNDLNAIFEDAYGRYMSVSILSASGYDNHNFVEVSDILNLKAEYGYFNFTINCGEHYVSYSVEADDALKVYEMVTSSQYFKN